jgi:serine protease Do
VEAYKIPEKEGAVVGDVVPGGPADRAGLRRGDVILSIGGQKVKSAQDVVLLIRNRLAGDKVTLEYVREGKRVRAELALGDIPGKGKAPGGEPGSPGGPRTLERMGILVADPTPEMASKYRLPTRDGAVVVEIRGGSPAASMGLQPGDQILEVNRRKISSASDFAAAFDAKPKALAMLIRRGDQTLFLSMETRPQ